ncbi:MAG: TlpA disulfide reductase family protein [Patescibacteria group bacterium]
MFHPVKITIGILALVALIFLLIRFSSGSFSLLFNDQSTKTKPFNNGNAQAVVGNAAPYFELSDIKGDRVRLSDLADTPLIITFWATWNSDSADQIKIFDDYTAKHTQGLFKIISINSQEDKSAVGAFIRRGDYIVPVLLDQTGAVGKSYGIETLPTSIFIDRDGVIREVFVGIMSEAMIVDKSEKILR